MCGGGHGGLLAPGQPPPPGLGVRGRVSFPRLLNRSGAASKGQTQACSRHHGRRQPGWARGSGAGTGRVKLATTGEQGWGLEGWRAENPAGHGASGYPRLHHAQQPQKHGPVLRPGALHTRPGAQHRNRKGGEALSPTGTIPRTTAERKSLVGQSTWDPRARQRVEPQSSLIRQQPAPAGDPASTHPAAQDVITNH